LLVIERLGVARLNDLKCDIRQSEKREQ
jgi:hypothetical protein